MAKIKIEENNIVLYYSEVSSSIYEIKKEFKLDLSNKKFFSVKQGCLTELNWELNNEEEQILIESLVKEARFQLENSYNVIYSYKQQGNMKEVEKNQKHLENNKKILDFLLSYKI